MPRDLRHRHRQPEVIDEPGLDAARHAAALRGLGRINWWSGSAGILWPSLRDLARKMPQPLRVLDVATGGGDVPIRLSRKARRAGLTLDIQGCDVSPTAIAYARQQATAAQAAVRFFEADALTAGLPDGFDVLTCSLFLHHLDEEHAMALLRRMAQAARLMLLVNDLRRSRLGYALAYLGTRVLTRSHIVHGDGPISVEGAFTCAEALALAQRAGLDGATIAPRWPFRFLLSWRRTPLAA
jgi:2-polyprenyl-3-methyl-5-hydroxy-6-metoxy-1,4-benzoquinol methylase